MSSEEFIAALKQGGVTVVVLGVILWFVGKFVGKALVKFFDRLLASLDRVADRLDEHTKVDVEYHQEVQQQLGEMAARIDTALDLTPVRQSRPKTNPRGVPTGYYPPRKPTLKDDD